MSDEYAVNFKLLGFGGHARIVGGMSKEAADELVENLIDSGADPHARVVPDPCAALPLPDRTDGAPPKRFTEAHLGRECEIRLTIGQESKTFRGVIEEINRIGCVVRYWRTGRDHHPEGWRVYVAHGSPILLSLGGLPSADNPP